MNSLCSSLFDTYHCPIRDLKDAKATPNLGHDLEVHKLN
jgi:hypothetical protein